MDTVTTMFAIDCVASTISLACIGGIARAHFVTRKLRNERDDAIAALRNEETEGAHWRELAEDALANIEGLQAKVAEERAAANRWATKYAITSAELRKMDVAERQRAAQRKAAGDKGRETQKRNRDAAAASQTKRKRSGLRAVA